MQKYISLLVMSACLLTVCREAVFAGDSPVRAGGDMPYQFSSFHRWFAVEDEFTPLRRIYVSPLGDDTNSGLSADDAFRTISRAVEIVKAGDLVTVYGGTYHESVHVENREGTEEHPIVFRGAEDETAVVTHGYGLRDWKKAIGLRHTYVADYDKGRISGVWDKQTLIRYTPYTSKGDVDEQPGSFYLDTESRKIYVNPRRNVAPEAAGIAVMPFVRGMEQATHLQSYGFLVDDSSYFRIENFTLNFHALGIAIGSGSDALKARNNRAYGCFMGIQAEGVDVVIEGNDLNRSQYRGLDVRGIDGTALLRNNLVWGNEPNSPLYPRLFAGHPYNLAQYGRTVEKIKADGNLVIQLRPRRDGTSNIVRYKSTAGTQHNLASNNVFVGGPVSLEIGKRETDVSWNTVIGGKLEVRRVAASTPRAEKNLYLDGIEHFDFKRGFLEEDGFADPLHLDFRLRYGSPHLGRGAHPEAAEVYYVSPGGDNSADGRTPGSAWRALGKAFNRASAGDTVYVLPGIYNEEGLVLSARGTADEPVRFRNYGNSRVEVRSEAGISIKDSAYVELTGFIIKGAGGDAVEISGSEYIRIAHSVLEGTTAGASVRNSGKVKFLNNTFYGCGSGINALGLTGNLVMRNNLFAGLEAGGFNSGEAVRRSGVKNTLAGGRIISERNAFTGDGAERKLSAWRGLFYEAHESIVTEDEISSPGYMLPYNSVLAYMGIGNNPVGAYGEAPNEEPVAVENFRVVAAFPEHAILSWETPYDFPDAELKLKSGCGRVLAEQPVPQPRDDYRVHLQSAVMTAEFDGLSPGAEYEVSLEIFTSDARAGSSSLGFRTPETVRAAKTVHVCASRGDDANDGFSRGKALRTIRTALRRAVPGDEILVAPGAYSEELEIRTGGLSEERPLVLRSEKPGEAVLAPGAIYDTMIMIEGVKHVTVDGFNFTGVDPNERPAGMEVINSEDIRIINNVWERKLRGTGAPLRLDKTNRIEIRNNLMTSNGNLVARSCSDVLVEGNTFYIGSGGMRFTTELGGEASDIRVLNNIMYNTATHHSATHSAVKVGIDSREGLICDYNLYWRSPGGWGDRMNIHGLTAKGRYTNIEYVFTIEEARERYGVEHNGKFANPMFVDPSRTKGGNFRLKEGSPAVGMGKDGVTVGYSYP